MTKSPFCEHCGFPGSTHNAARCSYYQEAYHRIRDGRLSVHLSLACSARETFHRAFLQRIPEHRVDDVSVDEFLDMTGDLSLCYERMRRSYGPDAYVLTTMKRTPSPQACRAGYELLMMRPRLRFLRELVEQVTAGASFGPTFHRLWYAYSCRAVTALRSARAPELRVAPGVHVAVDAHTLLTRKSLFLSPESIKDEWGKVDCADWETPRAPTHGDLLWAERWDAQMAAVKVLVPGFRREYTESFLYDPFHLGFRSRRMGTSVGETSYYRLASFFWSDTV